MKLSEMSTRRLAAALCELTEPASRIMQDEKLNGVLETMAKRMQAGALTNAQKVGLLLEAVPVLARDHYADVAAIAATLTGRTRAEIDEMNGRTLLAELRESVDEELIGFFRSSAGMGPTRTDADA